VYTESTRSRPDSYTQAHVREQLDVDAAVADGRFEQALDEFRRLGFAVRMISPADDPAVAQLEGGGMTIRLVSGDAEWPGELALPPLVPAFELSRHADTGWGVGRAGMLYRDLLPGRQGGRFIASHIRIPDAGSVPDEVHYHNIQFQLIFCVAGWVRLVYQGQGEPFTLNAGDCVLQPPGIRHRVLESSGSLEVVEITSPAVHETWFDPDHSLPTPLQELDFAGQRFVLHRAAEATWTTWRAEGFDCRDTGIGASTAGIAGARVVRATPGAETAVGIHDGELQFWFVLSGAASLLRPDRPAELLTARDSVAVPAEMAHGLASGDSGCEFLEVTVPARPAV
jgi:mannose-6-phosphate isomerase-like protein (cupin superfamily)